MSPSTYHCRICGIHLPPRLRAFTRDVLAERARLALEDPYEELSAIHPISQEQARKILRHLSEPVLSRPAPIRNHGPLNESDILDKLGVDYTSNDHGMTNCPGPLHPRGDQNKSLSSRWTGTRTVLHCFVGCDFQSIRAALS